MGKPLCKNEYFSKHLKADIVYSNFQNGTVVLTNFIYLLNMPALQREFIRVHPDIIAKAFYISLGIFKPVADCMICR